MEAPDEAQLSVSETRAYLCLKGTLQHSMVQRREKAQSQSTMAFIWYL